MKLGQHNWVMQDGKQILSKMNKLLFLFIVVFFCSCEPSNYLYIRNMTNNQVDITVKCTNKHFDGLDIDSVWFEDKIVKDINWNSVHDFTKKKVVEKIDSSSYKLSLNKKQTYLIEPKVIIPINEIIVEYPSKIDTIIFYGKNRNYNNHKSNIFIKKKGIYTVTTIVDLK